MTLENKVVYIQVVEKLSNSNLKVVQYFINRSKGLPLGSILTPALFNFY